jgi:hypothetical protein
MMSTTMIIGKELRILVSTGMTVTATMTANWRDRDLT